MKICLVQFDIAWGDPQANCAHLDALLAGAPGADLYVLPEMFTTGFATLEGATVEQEPSVGLAWMQRKAAELQAAVAGSVALQTPSGKCANRFFFVRPDGSYEHYDKRHLFGYGGEGERFLGGQERVVVEYGGVRFLLAVCYDVRFPVWLRNRDDYDAILLVASWPDVRRFAWDTLGRARAIENACYLAAVNRVGADPACSYNGGTAFIGPFGETLAAVPDGQEGFACAELDLEHLAAYHAKFPVLDDADSFEIK
ncbi:MAG: amidohydrolase [Bacteroidales bacterium]|nr:amidohydrolase [Bacteroidales bacterium]